jgi:hypothetical protein
VRGLWEGGYCVSGSSRLERIPGMCTRYVRAYGPIGHCSALMLSGVVQRVPEEAVVLLCSPVSLSPTKGTSSIPKNQ